MIQRKGDIVGSSKNSLSCEKRFLFPLITPLRQLPASTTLSYTHTHTHTFKPLSQHS